MLRIGCRKAEKENAFGKISRYFFNDNSGVDIIKGGTSTMVFFNFSKCGKEYEVMYQTDEKEEYTAEPELIRADNEDVSYQEVRIGRLMSRIPYGHGYHEAEQSVAENLLTSRERDEANLSIATEDNNLVLPAYISVEAVRQILEEASKRA